MKNKIKRFSKGDFRMVQPEIILPESSLVLSIGEGEVYKGSFILKNKNEGDIRGLVYSSSFRMRLDDQGFEGNPVRISYAYDGRGLKPGHVEHGKFTVVCNGGEYSIDFTVIIEKPYIMTNHGKIQNIRDFKNLAMKDFTEAQRLFRSRDFYEVVKYEEPRIRALYDNMRKWSLSEQAMEEFLVGIKQKESIFLTMAKTKRTFRNLKEDTKEIIHFTKNTWGYMQVKVHVEGDFIQIAKKSFSTDDFVGNLFDFGYIIHPEKIHAGNNFGSISFESPYETLTYEIMVADHKDHKEARGEAQLIVATAVKGFLSTMAGRNTIKEWAENTRKELSSLDIYTDNGNIYPLLDAHLHILCGEDNQADSILEDYSKGKHSSGKDTIVYSYYLYLTALVRKTGSHVNRVVEELNKSYMKFPRSWELVCMLVDIDPEYKNYTKRLRALERHFMNGSNQIFLYWQAYSCLLEHPTSLKKLSSFEIQVMNFAVKYGLVTKDIALYTANLATQQRNFDPTLDRILKRMYQLFPDEMILTAVCTHMIRGNRIETDCFKWYEMAVEQDLKIAQLYEYYMMSIDDECVRKEFPKSVYLYFMHGTSLNYKKTALLYANVIKYQDEFGELYAYYRERMERFAWEQLEKRRISETLRIIYKRCCLERDLNEDRMRAIYDICHAYEVKTTHKDIAFILILEPDGTLSEKIPYNQDGTIVNLYNKDDRIIWETRGGRRFIDSIPYDTIRLFFESRFLELCKRYEEEHKQIEKEKEKEELTWNLLKENGADSFDDEDVFKLCSEKISDEGLEEDDFLSFTCYDLFEKGKFDKNTLTYLAEFYCGPTYSMKKIWHAAREFVITTYKLSERIITQMLFSEMMFGEEEMFADYYDGRTYFRLKQAYLAYVSREYVVSCRQVKGCIFNIIAKEYRKEEELADICKIALLKYYSTREMHEELAAMLRNFLRELCEKQLYFAFYLSYPEEWLREVQLYDKTMIEYHAKPGSKVEISYQIKSGDDTQIGYNREVLLPSYENVYIKTFVLFKNETIRYFFTETNGKNVTISDKKTHAPNMIKPIGRYGRLNNMIDMNDDDLKKAMKEFAAEKELSEEIFTAY